MNCDSWNFKPVIPHRMRKLNIYVYDPACFTVITRKKHSSIKLTSPPFHVWKEVIIVLYTADEARPIMMEGWTERFLCAEKPALSCLSRPGCLKWRSENWGGCIRTIKINSTRLSSRYVKSSVVLDVLPVYVSVLMCGWTCITHLDKFFLQHVYVKTSCITHVKLLKCCANKFLSSNLLLLVAKLRQLQVWVTRDDVCSCSWEGKIGGLSAWVTVQNSASIRVRVVSYEGMLGGYASVKRTTQSRQRAPPHAMEYRPNSKLRTDSYSKWWWKMFLSG